MIEPRKGSSFRMNVSRNKPHAPESWNAGAYHQPDRFGTVNFGRGEHAGQEIRQAHLDCAGDEWTISVEVVGVGDTPQEVAIAAEVKKDDRVIALKKGELEAVTADPRTRETFLRLMGTRATPGRSFSNRAGA